MALTADEQRIFREIEQGWDRDLENSGPRLESPLRLSSRVRNCIMVGAVLTGITLLLVGFVVGSGLAVSLGLAALVAASWA